MGVTMTSLLNRLTALALAAWSTAFWAAPAAAVQPLQGRTIIGTAVASTDPTAVMAYDPNLNITWLRDWNKHGPFLFWNDAQSWASTLKVGSFGGWSLPAAYNLDGSPRVWATALRPCGDVAQPDQPPMGWKAVGFSARR